MNSIDIAKRSAAMETCIALHKIGELSDRLVPNTMESIAQNTDYLFPHWVEEDKSKIPLIATYKMKRRYKSQVCRVVYELSIIILYACACCIH